MFYTNIEFVPSESSPLSRIFDLTGTDFQNSSGQTRAKVLLDNTGRTRAMIKIHGSDDNPFPGNPGVYVLHAGNRVEFDICFPCYILVGHAGWNTDLVQLPSWESASVSGIAYKVEV